MNAADPLGEYPRPQLERSQWQSLDGAWQFEPGDRVSAPPLGVTLPGRILVPYPVGSPLSGVTELDDTGWYRRTFSVPDGWSGRHVLLHFGAVAWAASVYVNGQLVGSHSGDYDAFTLDITGALHSGANELVVGYVDAVGGSGEPVGKQIPGDPYGFHHTASRGIWQPVWLEPVGATYVDSLSLVPDLGRGAVVVTPTIVGPPAGVTLRVQALDGSHVVATASELLGAAGPGATVSAGAGSAPLVVAIPHPRLWSPLSPFLYGLRVELLGAGGVVLDQLSSYVGMRSISLGRVGGVTRILLNGHFLFEAGALDQGMWPDGLYTPPTDAAMRADIQRAQQFGFNMLREHVKVEPDRWYYWADRLGMLVWQDMPSLPLTGHPTRIAAYRGEYLRELRAIVAQLRSHPSIVTWVPFNEGWGEFDLDLVTRVVRSLDPTRLIDTDSGSASCCEHETPDGDLRDTHVYFGPFGVAPDARASVIGEFGGVLPVPPAADRFPAVPTSIGAPVAAWSTADISGLIAQQYGALATEVADGGVSAAVFTELFAAEQELGLVSYDRRVATIDPALMRSLNASVLAAGRAVDRGVGEGARSEPPAGATYWPLDENGGSVAAAQQDGSGAVGGSGTGGGDQLTLSGDVGWTHGVSGSALSFGTGGGSAASSAPLLDTTNSFTVSAWLSPHVGNETAAAVSESGGSAPAFALGISSESSDPAHPRSSWTFSVAWNGCGGLCRARASLFYADGRFTPKRGSWSFVTGVYDRPSNTVALYVNGLGVDVEHAGGPGVAASGALLLGGGAGASAGAFAGAVDELRVYPQALTADQVWRLYAASRAGAFASSGRTAGSPSAG